MTTTIPDEEAAETFPDVRPRLTIDRFIRSRAIAGRDGELMGAFAHVERLNGPLRKLTLDEWVSEFKAWRGTPR